ncbi:hypothetical protein P3T76_011792 [Phytophthora citrophthora]|uniref:Uncharacterized protein n=1 Tax=Phytophthora citrophthora TaxID=4793 RepID=A0AAD9LEK4_9STRA|nr:hypothetical protein P3T76_011792 [Phytophthora citrophthora]
MYFPFSLGHSDIVHFLAMTSLMALFSATALVVIGYLSTQVNAHGYMLIPLAEFKGKDTSAWIVQIDPQFDADWQSVKGDTELIALYVEKAKAAGYENNIRKLLDSDTKLYGADCGFTDPKAKPKDPPTDGTATFSRGIAHHGPCEIWLDDTMVLHDDDCEKTFGTEDYLKQKSVLKPIDYSSCASGGCMLRFYWLAFQGVDGKYVWQIYKDCVPLSGPAEGQTSTATTSASNSAQSTETPANGSEYENEAPKATEATVTATQEPASTPAVEEKCNDVSCISTPVNGHGYMTIPEAVPLSKHKKDKKISSWIVQIEPQFKADWNSIGNDDDLIALYVEKAKESGYDKDIRKLLDSNTKLYGADCGYSDPNATPKTPPSDGTATFSRGIAHHGPCEIWVGDKMALHDDDCAKTFGAEDYMSIKSVFKPIDYSSCPSSGCMFRFYWLAFQGSDNGYVWQIYKHCVPLTGPPAGQTSTATTSSGSAASNTTQSEATVAMTEAPNTENQPHKRHGLTTHVQGHGYMYIPLTEFKGTGTGAWIVQIAPQFQANWESVANDEELIALYVEKAKEAGYANNIRKFLDSDTNLYGANCGFSNPDAKAKDPPSDGTATFERGLAHHGPCEIWLDDTMILHNDDCAQAFSVEDYMSIKSVFKPIDYSSCSSSGCMFRFYWLAFQGSTSGKYVWQIYKDCIPLTGPGAGKTSTASASNTTQPSDTTQTPEVQAQTPQVQPPSPTSAPSQTNAPTTENNTPEVQATQAPMATQAQWTPALQTRNIPKTLTILALLTLLKLIRCRSRRRQLRRSRSKRSWRPVHVEIACVLNEDFLLMFHCMLSFE